MVGKDKTIVEKINEKEVFYEYNIHEIS